MENSNPGFIVIEGPIGAGKTSLAKRLAASFGTELLLEGPEENPFLERFYQNPRQAALPTQLHFLFQRARQLKDMCQTDMFCPVRIADFMMEKDKLFARINLDDDELRLYEQVYAQLTIDVPTPDLVIYLQAPAEVLMERVARRGIDYESNIQLDYLQRLSEGYIQFFHNFTASPLLIVNAAEIDLINNDKDYNVLLEQVRTHRRGRCYFNTMSFDM